ncbi:MFS transporter [Candidatus Uhrbacteria bacterium]|nr:MFS transporter [Candidatus Uhrbacteria bacterium]
MPRLPASTKRRALHRIHLLIFLYSLGIALSTYVGSSYLQGVVGTGAVESIYIASAAFTIIGMVLLPAFVHRVGKRMGFSVIAVLLFASSILLSMVALPVIAVLSFTLYTAATWMVLLGFDVALEQYSSDGNTGRLRGWYLTIMNAGWVVAPLVMGSIGQRFGIQWVFAASAVAFLPMSLLFPTMFRSSDDRSFHHHEHLRDALRRIIQIDGLWKVTLVAFALQFFYAWMVIYAPLYLHDTIGFSWGMIGWMFSIMLIPFVLTEYPAGVIADRWWGEKELMIVGFVVMAVASIVFGVMSPSASWLAFAGVLFCSRVGASIVESMRDTYFYKHVDSDDIAIISVFHMVWILPYVIAPVLGAAMLTTVGYADLFVMLGGLLVILSGAALYRLSDTK